MLVFVIVAFVLITVASRSVIVVPERSAYIVERLGQYLRTLPAGLHVLLPLVDSVRYRFSLDPREEPISYTCITRDNVPVRIASVVRAQIADPYQAAYASANAGDFVATLVRTHQRQWIGEHAWEEVRTSMRDLEVAVEQATIQPAASAGVKVLAVELKGVDQAES